MAKQKGPKSNDFINHPDRIETRLFSVVREGCDPPSKNWIMFDCPFCGDRIKAYKWSLAGGGKRCDCGAFITDYGQARHFKA